MQPMKHWIQTTNDVAMGRRKISQQISAITQHVWFPLALGIHFSFCKCTAAAAACLARHLSPCLIGMICKLLQRSILQNVSFWQVSIMFKSTHKKRHHRKSWKPRFLIQSWRPRRLPLRSPAWDPPRWFQHHREPSSGALRDHSMAGTVCQLGADPWMVYVMENP